MFSFLAAFRKYSPVKDATRRNCTFCPRCEPLEERVAMTAAPAHYIAVGADAGGGPHVQVFESHSGVLLMSFFAYDQGFRGGVRVATGDVTGDGIDDIITAAGPGGGPHIKVFDGANGVLIREFFAYDAGFRGGVFVAVGVNHDGHADIVTGAGEGGGPHVKVFDGTSGALLSSFMAYDPAFTGGVRVAAAEVTGDVEAELFTVPGKGGGPHVKIFNGTNRALLKEFMAFDSQDRGGWYIAAHDGVAVPPALAIRDPVPRAPTPQRPMIMAVSEQSGGRVRKFDIFATMRREITPFPAAPTAAIRVAFASIQDDSDDDLVMGRGPGGYSPLQFFFEPRVVPPPSFTIEPFNPEFLGGIFVG